MIRLNHPIFPHLIRKDEVSFKSWSDSDKTTTVYKIDWEKLDQYKYQKFTDDAKRYCHMPYDYQFPGTLPEPYDSWVKSLEFTIPVRYLEEIRYNARMAQMIYCSSHPFDTMIREICYEPAIAHVFVAFRLIADCTYSRETNYFYRGDEKIIIPQALLYKFWVHQVGDGLIQDHSYFNKIKTRLKFNDKGNESHCRTIQKFINATNDFQEKLTKLHEIRCVEKEPDNYLIINDSSSITPNSVKIKAEGDASGNLFSVNDKDGNNIFSVKDPNSEKTDYTSRI